jgi:hypothetical protein
MNIKSGHIIMIMNIISIYCITSLAYYFFLPFIFLESHFDGFSIVQRSIPSLFSISIIIKYRNWFAVVSTMLDQIKLGLLTQLIISLITFSFLPFVTHVLSEDMTNTFFLLAYSIILFLITSSFAFVVYSLKMQTESCNRDNAAIKVFFVKIMTCVIVSLSSLTLSAFSNSHAWEAILFYIIILFSIDFIGLPKTLISDKSMC